LKSHAFSARAPHGSEAGFAVYDGRDWLGRVVESPGGWHASTVDGRDLGRHPNMAAASHAVLEAARVR
jgi:hypothetical protein